MTAAKSKRSSKKVGVIPEEEFNDLNVIFEQQVGLMDLLMDHMQDLPQDNAGLTAVNLTKKLAIEAERIITDWYRTPGFIQIGEQRRSKRES
jgi:hypothetical protein